MSKPDFLALKEHPYSCPFRDACMEVLQKHAMLVNRNIRQDRQFWIAQILDGIEISFIDEQLIVHHRGDLIWGDGPGGFRVEDHEADEYEDMLDRFLVLDRLADV